MRSRVTLHDPAFLGILPSAGGGGGVDGYNCTRCDNSATIFVEDGSLSKSQYDIWMITDGGSPTASYLCVEVGTSTTGSAGWTFDTDGFTDCTDCEMMLP